MGTIGQYIKYLCIKWKLSKMNSQPWGWMPHNYKTWKTSGMINISHAHAPETGTIRSVYQISSYNYSIKRNISCQHQYKGVDEILKNNFRLISQVAPCHAHAHIHANRTITDLTWFQGQYQNQQSLRTSQLAKPQLVYRHFMQSAWKTFS